MIPFNHSSSPLVLQSSQENKYWGLIYGAGKKYSQAQTQLLSQAWTWACRPFQESTVVSLSLCSFGEPGRQGAAWWWWPFWRALGEVQGRALSLSIHWTWTKSLLNGGKIPSGVPLPCLWPSLCYFGANYVVCRVSPPPDLVLSSLWPFAWLLLLSADRGQREKVPDFNQPPLPLVSTGGKIFTECFIFGSQGSGHPGIIYGFHYSLYSIHYNCEEPRFAYIPNTISSLQRGLMPWRIEHIQFIISIQANYSVLQNTEGCKKHLRRIRG